MSLYIGIIGLPNVGKSTLFNALTKSSVPALNYPFCTIEPNVGVVTIPDQRLLDVAKIVKPKTITGAVMHFVDIAGLVKGASRGDGLGNQFLAHIREVDAIIHVVRLFEDDNVSLSPGQTGGLADLETIDTELLLADIQAVETRKEKTQRLLKTGETRYKAEMQQLDEILVLLNQGIPARNQESVFPTDLHLLTNKPVLYVANISETDSNSEESKQKLAPLVAKASKEHSEVIPIAAGLEAEFAELPAEEAYAFLQELGCTEFGVHRLIHASVELLGLLTFYTVKGVETRAWLVPDGTLAPQAAGKIHSDMERGFIRAEVVSSTNLLMAGSLANAREQGLVRIEGRDYPIACGDVVLFRFNV